MQAETRPLLLSDLVFPRRGVLVNCVLVAAFTFLTAISAQFSVWVGAVPVTGQTLVVLLSGVVLGSRLGALSQLGYLAVGATGIPFWFALGGIPGIARIVGPTGGYLIGFVAAAFVTGWLAEKGWDRKVVMSGLAMLVGNVVIYLFGLAQLGLFIPSENLLKIGLIPFVLGDVLKISIAAILLPYIWRLKLPS